jgi:hypothetical protein
MPSISGRAFSSATMASSPSVEIDAGGVMVSLWIPSSPAVFRL